VRELVQLKIDVLVVTALTAVRVAKQATKTIPIVMVILSDPVATGIVDSLARPGGNITGFTRLTRELSGKRLELLKETIPEYRVPLCFGKRAHREQLLPQKSIRPLHMLLKYSSLAGTARSQS
jgi:ABC transporter substrate binding protein